MSYKQLYTGILASILLVGIITGCSNKEETTSKLVEEIPELYTSMDWVSDNDSPTNLGLMTIQSIMNKDKNLFSKLVKLDGTLLDIDYVWNDIINNVEEIPEGSKVYAVNTDATNSNKITVFYAINYADYYKKDENGEVTNEKLGEVVEEFKQLPIYFYQEGDKYYINTNYLVDTRPIYISIPEGSKLKVGGTEISDDCRNKDGYYVVTNFLKSDPVKLTIDTAIMQGMEFSLPLTEIVSYDSNGNPKYRDTDRIFNGLCYLDLSTKQNVMKMLNEAIPAVLKSLEAGEDIHEASCLKYFASTANLDDIALRWQTGRNAIKNQRRAYFTDIKMLNIGMNSDASARDNKSYQNIIISNNVGIININMKTSFEKYDKYGDNTISDYHTLGSAYISFIPIYFAIEDGEYKIVDISAAFFENLVK